MRKLAAALVALALATPALATEGGIFGSWTAANRTTEMFYLCDGSHAAANACAAFDLRTVGTNQKRGVPTSIQFAIHRQTAACTPTVTVVGQFASGTDATRVDHTIVALIGAGTSSYSPPIVPEFPVYSATVSADAQCTDLEVLLVLHYDNN